MELAQAELDEIGGELGPKLAACFSVRWSGDPTEPSYFFWKALRHLDPASFVTMDLDPVVPRTPRVREGIRRIGCLPPERPLHKRYERRGILGKTAPPFVPARISTGSAQ